MDAGLISVNAQLAYTRRAAPEETKGAYPLLVEMLVHEMPSPPSLFEQSARPAAAGAAAGAAGAAAGAAEAAGRPKLGREVSRSSFVVQPRTSQADAGNSAPDGMAAPASAFARAHAEIMGSSGSSSSAAAKLGAARRLTHLYSSSADRGTIHELQLPPAMIRSPREWSDEAPNLYCVTIILREQRGAGGAPSAGAPSAGDSGDGAAGAPLEVISIPVGFRRIELSGGEMRLNGRAVMIKGVNRHEHDPYTGHVVSREAMRADVLAMKALNINAVRCSHYPNGEPYRDRATALSPYLACAAPE